ncbi:hypothetical protein RHMOL_Rhmol08G0246800 [Rhododendron molle]|uniref:Uncharacterized protein n=1 Tax=Rhododendron molle TaxID=49168 RepID=A0ACC0MRX8_RHOML|nr:hypothetical protein RHMOL_Rhmol08G0246800 [Rhododendron molle]
MVVPVPFHRWVHVKHRNPRTVHGGFYCLLPIQGQRVIAAVARYRHGGQLEYKAYSMFVREYADLLGLSDNLVWAVRDDLVKWLDALVHNSFVRYSTPGVDRCWYLRRISQFLAFAPTMLVPQGLRSSFEGIGRSTWILLRHGCKAWPIQVVDAVMQKGWREFRTAHGIAANYKLILMCERKWIFNAIIFDENDIEISYNWTMLVNEHSREFHTIQGNLITGCLPSTILRNLPLIKSGYYCIPGGNYLELQVHDYVFIAMLPNLEVRVVILDAANDRERIYDWL